MSEDTTILNGGLTSDASQAGDTSGDATVIGAPITHDGTQEMSGSLAQGETILNHYKVVSDAIVGGMGRVFKVHHTGWDVDLALKQPRAHFFQTNEHKEFFTREADAWINLGLHPHIVSCYYVRQVDGIPSIFSEWMEGGSLGDWMKSAGGQIPRLYEGTAEEQLERILDIAIQYARGLRYAHDQGLIHQDVKPDNLLLTANGSAKVADFGIAQARVHATLPDSIQGEGTEAQTLLSQSGAYTPAYCSTEQMNGRTITHRTDIYSWAVTLLEMLIQNRPWPNGVVAGLGYEEYFELSSYDTPSHLRDLLRNCLQEDESLRPPDFSFVEEELCAIYEEVCGVPYPRVERKAASDTAASLNNRALSYLDLGKEDEAESFFLQALESDGVDPDVVFNKTVFEWRKGIIDDIDAYEVMLNNYRIDETDEHRALLMAMICTERLDFDGAQQYLRQVVDERYQGEKTRIEAYIAHETAQAAKTKHPDSYASWMQENLNTRSYRFDDTRYSPVDVVDCKDTIRVFYSFYENLQSTGVIKIFESGSGGLAKTIPVALHHFSCAAFSACGNYLVVGGKTVVHLLNGATGDPIREFTVPAEEGWPQIDAVGITYDNRHILVASHDPDSIRRNTYKVDVFSLDSGNLIRTIPTDTSTKLDRMVLSPFSSLFVWTSAGKRSRRNVSLWDWSTGKCCVSKSGAGTLDIFLGSDKRWIYVEDSACEMEKFYLPSSLYQAPFSLSRITDTDTRFDDQEAIESAVDRVEQYLAEHDVASAWEAFLQAETIDGFVCSEVWVSLKERIGRYCRVKGIRSAWRLTDAVISNEIFPVSRTYGKLYAPNSNYVFDHDTKELYRRGKERKTKIIAPDRKAVQQASFSNDASKLLLRFEDIAILYNVRNQKELQLFSAGNFILSARYLPDGRIAILGKEGLYLWDSSGKKLLDTFEKGDISNNSCISSDGRFAFLSLSTPFNLFTLDFQAIEHLSFMIDLDDVSIVRSFEGHTDYVVSASLSNDGQYLVTSADMTRLFSVATGECIYSIQDNFCPRFIRNKNLLEHDPHYPSGSSDKGDPVWFLDWDFEFPGWADWDEGASPYVETFLRAHPDWNETDFDSLIEELQERGYGWLRPEGIRSHLKGH